MKYFVNYGLNNSHMTEFEHFDLYREAKEFYKNLDVKYQAKVCYKAVYDKNGYMCKKEPKLYSFESRADNTKMLKEYVVFPN